MLPENNVLSVNSIIDKIYKEIYLLSTKENYNNLSRTSEVLTDLFYNFEKKSFSRSNNTIFFNIIKYRIATRTSTSRTTITISSTH